MQGAAASVIAIVLAVTSALAGGNRAEPPLGGSPEPLPSDPAGMAASLLRAQQTIDNPSSPSAAVQRAGQLEQLAITKLSTARGRVRRAVLAELRGPAAASIRADLGAATALARLNTPRRSLPPWKIVAAPPPNRLLGYFKAAQARFRVPWQYLAAIELVETQFGRVVGLSTAGAEGPMQFMPDTWAEYGRGDVHNPRAAILAAARFLDANGAPGNMPGAIYHYNPSRDYVRAVTEYAARLRRDPRAYYAYYYWRVIYGKFGGAVILPVGFPKARPIPLDRMG